MKSKGIFCLLLALCLVFAFSACKGGSETPSDSPSGSGTDASTSSKDSEGAASPDDGSAATLTISVQPNTPEAFTPSHTKDPNKEDITMILVIGQSNFEMGCGYRLDYRQYYEDKTTDILPVLPITPPPGVGYSSLRHGSLTTLDPERDMANLIDPALGPKMVTGVTPPFAAEWNNLTGTKIVFIQAAAGATGMHEWVPDPQNYVCVCPNNGQGKLYSNAVANYKLAYNTLSKNYNIVYSGYIWNQGEHEQTYYENVTITDSQGYYDAYKSMHDGLISTLGLDFGGISVVRYNRIFPITSQASMHLSLSRLAQYRLCNDIDNLYMLSTIAETCNEDQMGAGSDSGHMKQSVFNTMGTEMADNLYKLLGLGEQSEYEGVQVYAEDGSQICAFDAEGKVTDGTAVVSVDESNPEILVKLAALGTAYTVDYSISYNGKVIDGGIDKFGKFDLLKLGKEGIKSLKVVCETK